MYHYRIKLPPGVTYERTMPPNPDHGFRIELGARATVWADASYTDSASTDDEVAARTAGCRVERNEPARLGPMAARSVRFTCPAVDGPAYEEEWAGAVSRGKGRSPVCYQIALRTDVGQTTEAAQTLLARLIAGFRLDRRY